MVLPVNHAVHVDQITCFHAIRSILSQRRRVRGPGLQVFVGRMPTRLTGVRSPAFRRSGGIFAVPLDCLRSRPPEGGTPSATNSIVRRVVQNFFTVLVALTPEQTSLSERQRPAAAGGTNVLIMRFAVRRSEAVVEAELIQQQLQIVDVHRRRVVIPAPTAMRPRARRARRFVKRYAERAGS